MKSASFDYACPNTLSEAIGLLAAHEGAKLISGGQSLLPLMNFRLAAPTMLVDLRKLSDLRRIHISERGVDLGARVHWCDIEQDSALRAAHPLLLAMIDHVAHYQVRNRGTVGGSLAHADPAAEMPGLAVTCDATLTLIGSAGSRDVPAGAFFEAPLTTVLEPDEIIVKVHLPFWPAGRRWGFLEFARRRGDFALAGVAAFYDPDETGKARNVHVGVIGLCDVPRRLPAVEAVLEGQLIDDAAIAQAGEAIAAAVEPSEDIHASADYRRALARTLLERVLRQASTKTNV